MTQPIKRILCILLSCLLGTAVLVPAFAEADPYTPVITEQPDIVTNPNVPKPFFVLAGKNVQVEVDADVPDETGVLSYTWYTADWTPDSDAQPIATGRRASISIPKNIDSLMGYYAIYEICAVVTNTFEDADGEERTISVKSKPLNLVVLNSPVTGFVALCKTLWNTMGISGIVMGLPIILFFTIFYTVFYPLLLMVSTLSEI